MSVYDVIILKKLTIQLQSLLIKHNSILQMLLNYTNDSQKHLHSYLYSSHQPEEQLRRPAREALNSQQLRPNQQSSVQIHYDMGMCMFLHAIEFAQMRLAVCQR